VGDTTHTHTHTHHTHTLTHTLTHKHTHTRTHTRARAHTHTHTCNVKRRRVHNIRPIQSVILRRFCIQPNHVHRILRQSAVPRRVSRPCCRWLPQDRPLPCLLDGRTAHVCRPLGLKFCKRLGREVAVPGCIACVVCQPKGKCDLNKSSAWCRVTSFVNPKASVTLTRARVVTICKYKGASVNIPMQKKAPE
jgi:hypothetical protein